ncbi:MAG: response regulator [Defluviitaleaceae bacterium]|nr:response regulator [Defluviitaleaceae bacterium]
MDAPRDTIIVVDDADIFADLAKSILDDDYDVYTASSGEELFNLLKETVPALILLDIKMPGMDGFDVNRKLKANKKTADIPVIFLTGANNHEHELKALSEGAVDYIIKPFIPDILKIRVNLHLLQRRQVELQLANNAKTAFIVNMSHEMRTPLNAIIGFSEMSLDIGGLSEELYINLMNIKGAGATLLSLISDVLDISKIESGKFEFAPIEYNTANMIQDAVTQSILSRGEKPISFKLDIHESFPRTVIGDELRVKQILCNLLSNAFKFTLEGEVTLSIDTITDDGVKYIRAVVNDTGIGIKESHLSNIFNAYSQMYLPSNNAIMGTGLGLPISRMLAEMMGGGVSAKSEFGKGSTFTAWITQKALSDEPISPKIIEDIKNFRYSELSNEKTRAIPQLKLPDAHILVVDDIDTNLAVAAGMLKRYSIKVDCVKSGSAAIEAMKNETIRYNAIFMDYMMPEMNGIEAAHQIRKIGTDYAANIPIIALTANVLAGNEEMFLENGLQAFITKPIKPQNLHNIITQWICVNAAISTLPESTSSEAPHFSVDGIDFAKGMERFGGDWEAYYSVLRTFAQNTPLIMEKVIKVTEADIYEYTIAVHGLKGACYGIEANETAALAYALEEAAKQEDFAFITENNDAFINNINSLLSKLKAALELIQSSKNKQKKDAPDPALIKNLKEACARHDMNAVDTAVDELDAFEYTNGGELVAWLREMADEMSYDDISKRLSDCKIANEGSLHYATTVE